MDRVGIGIIGCGNISEAYLKAASFFPILDIRGVADVRQEAAEARASQFGLRAMSVDALLADPSIEIVDQPDDPGRPRGGRAAGPGGRQARSLGKAARPHHGARRVPCSTWRGSGACGSAVRRTPSWAAPIRPAASSSTRARSAARSPAAPSSCVPAMSAGIPTRHSTTQRAADRCWTWVPTTSPPSST